MALFSRARQILKIAPSEPPVPQIYRVSCSQGHVLRGHRTAGYQAIRCPGCGEGLFVLPGSPLPEPPRPRAEGTRSRRDAQPAEDEPIRWVDAPAQCVEVAAQPSTGPTDVVFFDEIVAPDLAYPESLPAAEARSASNEAPATTSPPVGAFRGKLVERSRPRAAERRESLKSVRAAPGTGQVRRVELQPRQSLKDQLWRHRHLFALAGVLSLVLATVGYRSYRSRWEQLPRIAEGSRTLGLEALARGQFDVAKRELDRAADALEALRDPQALPARQAANEAAIFADLANSSLEELVEEVATRPGDSKAPFTQKGRTVLIDTRIAVAGRPGSSPELEYRILSGGKQGRIDLASLEVFRDSTFKAGEALTFGARLDSIQLGEDNLWHVRFEPDSGVLLSSPEGWKAAEHLGWPGQNENLEDLQ